MSAPSDVRLEIASRARARRLVLNLSQEGLSRRSGVSLGSLKRFEKTGQVSLASLLQIALVLDALEEFDGVFKTKTLAPSTLDELIQVPRLRQKGRIK